MNRNSADKPARRSRPRRRKDADMIDELQPGRAGSDEVGRTGKSEGARARRPGPREQPAVAVDRPEDGEADDPPTPAD